VTVPDWGPRLRELGAYPWLAAAIAVIAFIATARGVAAGYPGAIKGAVLGGWPLLAIPVAGLYRQGRISSRWVAVALCAPVVGLVISELAGFEVIASAYGMYLAIAAAWATTPRMPHRRIVAVATVVGSILLLGFGDKRGPILALLAAVVGAFLASGRNAEGRPNVGRRLALLAAIAAVSAPLLLLVASKGSSWPVVGGLVQRVKASTNTTTEAGANVSVRFEVWRYALDEADAHPIFGAGAQHPIRVNFRGNDFSKSETGPHNSFIGYAFYTGYPAALAVCACCGLELFRSWRRRGQLPEAAFVVGAVLAVVVTSLTNVVFETTYGGGPAWLVIACGATVSARQHLKATSDDGARWPGFRVDGDNRTVPAATRG